MIARKHKAVSDTMSIAEGKRGKSFITEGKCSDACEKSRKNIAVKKQVKMKKPPPKGREKNKCPVPAQCAKNKGG